jgi:hypothetical protein
MFSPMLLALVGLTPFALLVIAVAVRPMSGRVNSPHGSPW